MPGIVGIVTKMSPAAAQHDLQRMLSAIRHESFYVTGIDIQSEEGVYVGWAARKNSFCDQMPLRNETGAISLVFAGEEYPEPGTVRYLKELGHSVAEESPSYLVHLYEENPDFIANLNGRFHGLLTDRHQGMSTLFNDRYGLQRIYYYETDEAFYFAAEAKAILAVRPELRKLDEKSLGEFVSCGCVLENRSIFEGIHVLPPASAWTFRAGRVDRKGKYFEESEWEKQSTLEPEAYYQELKNVFARNLPRYFEGMEKVGMSVTGGLDTRMILAWRKLAANSMPCYSFGGSYRDSQDVKLGRYLAKLCGQSHTEIPVGTSFLSSFDRYAERSVYLSDGCVDVSHSPDLYINQRAREIAPARMTGNYGGEVMRRVRAFKPVEPPHGLFSREFLPHIAAAKETYNGLLRAHPLSFAVFRQAPWHHYGLLALEQTQLTLRSPFLDNDFVRTIFRAPASANTSDNVCLRLIAEGDPKLIAIRTDRGLAGDRSRLASVILQNWLEFTFKAEYAYDYGMPQSVAKIDHRLSALHLEKLFLGRHKFYHFRVWYRDALSKYVREMLLDSRALSRGYVERQRVEQIVRDHTNGNGNYTTAIHKLLTLEVLHKVLLENERESPTVGLMAEPYGVVTA
jgi:asparagine synthase (glutamine-hydrolysing)